MYATDRISSDHQIPGTAEAVQTGNKRRGILSRIIGSYQRCFEELSDPETFMTPM